MRRRAPIRSLRRRCGGASDRLRPPECAYLERAVYDENDLAEDEASWRDHIGDNPLPPLRPDEALQLLWLHRRTCRLGWDHRDAQYRVATNQEAKTDPPRPHSTDGVERRG
ncbi:hypothetical protein [Allosphingosinicella sp.]|uniref:hypothetical protein n=1 Tax=Allosphingosinicella sp. TaxID=2823234 RepID=UPI003D70BC8E